MKKYLLTLVFSLFVVLAFNSSAYSAVIPDCEFELNDFIALPVGEDEHYILSVTYGSYKQPQWGLTVSDTNDYVVNSNDYGKYVGPCYVKQYSLSAQWDSIRELWYIPSSWTVMDAGTNVPSGSWYGWGYSPQFAYHSMDIYKQGVLLYAANPIPAPPAPPLAELANPSQVLENLGGTATPILEISLMILALILVISLVASFLRSWLLHKV